jgi:hypothetical protein
MARQAMREGTLRVTLPDGSRYPVRMEGQSTDAAGRWSVVGRVSTAIGGQAMVLTFGPDAVFGVLPTPSGHAMQIITGPGGRTSVVPAGGLSSDGKPMRSGASDFRVPEAAITDALLRAEAPSKPHDLRATGAQVDRVAPLATPGLSASASFSQVRGPIVPPVQTTPVEIKVLAMYSGDLVTLRGSVSAAETEVANLFAIANQAHIDSGSRVRLAMVGLQRVDLAASLTNDEVLTTLTSTYPPVDVEGMRDTYEADLAAYIRPVTEGDSTCGASWLNGAGYRGNSYLQAIHGYVVADVAPCGVYALAHHLGHAMGAAHDRQAQTTADGSVLHGAYAFSFAERTSTFSTIMADPGDTQWLGRFSSPDPTGCNGAPCGVADRIDNVRTFNLMAPAIAAFRGPKDTAWIADAQFGEDRYHMLYVPVRISMPAPPEGLELTVTVGGGTATPQEDYFQENWSARFLGGERETFVPLHLRDDTTIEGAETVPIHLSGPAGVVISNSDAVGTILDDDPRVMISGRVIAGPGVTLPSHLNIRYFGSNGEDLPGSFGIGEMAWGPDYAFSFPYVPGAPVRIALDDTSLYTLFDHPAMLSEAWQDQQLDLVLDKRVRIRGALGVVPGMVQQQPYGPDVTIHQYVDGKMVGSPMAGYADGVPYTYEYYALPGATVEIWVNGTGSPTEGNTVPFATWVGALQNVRQDTTFDVAQSGVESIVARVQGHVMEGEDAKIEVERTAWQPTTTVQFDYHTVDGTAKAGTDYVATSGTATIGPDQGSVVLTIPTMHVGSSPRSATFDVVIDAISGGEMHMQALHVTIANTDRRTGGVSQVFKK